MKYRKKNFISLFPVDLLPSNMTQCLIILRGSQLLSHMSLRSCGHVISGCKIKTLCLCFYKTYIHQTWNSIGLGWGSHLPSHMSLWSSGQVTSRYELKKYLHFHKMCKFQTWYRVNLVLSSRSSHLSSRMSLWSCGHAMSLTK